MLSSQTLQSHFAGAGLSQLPLAMQQIVASDWASLGIKIQMGVDPMPAPPSSVGSAFASYAALGMPVGAVDKLNAAAAALAAQQQLLAGAAAAGSNAAQLMPNAASLQHIAVPHGMQPPSQQQQPPLPHPQLPNVVRPTGVGGTTVGTTVSTVIGPGRNNLLGGVSIMPG